MKYLVLFSLLILSIQALTYENQRQKLKEKLSELIIYKGNNYINYQSNTNLFTRTQKVNFKFIFDYSKVDKLDEIKNRYGLSSLISQEIQSTIDNRITGVVDDSEMDNFSKGKDNYYTLFRLSFGAALKERDIIYFMVLEASFYTELKFNTLVTEGENCQLDCRNIKRCYKEKYLTPLNYMASQIKIILDEAYYQIFNSIHTKATFLDDPTIQLYISNGNSIYSEDGENAAYIGEFGDIAIGPTQYLNSIQPLKYYYVYNTEGYFRYYKMIGEYTCFLGAKSLMGSSGIYPGQMEHKFNMLLGNVNPTSTVYTHRKQMQDGINKGPYSLILYKNGELTLMSNKKKISEVMWTSNTKDIGIAPYKLKLSKDYRLKLLDSNDVMVFQSKEYINIPTIKYRGDCNNNLECSYFPESYNGYEINHDYYSSSFSFLPFQMGVDDKSYPNLQVDYYYLDYNNRWIKNKKPFSYLSRPTYIKNFPKSLKMILTGTGSDKFKICYYVRKYKSNRDPTVIKTPIVCDGMSTEVTDNENLEYMTSFIAFITLKTDANPQ